MPSQGEGVLLFVLIIVCFISLAPKKPMKTSLEKVQQLTELTARKSIIRLDGETLEEHLTPPRDFSVVVMFTYMSEKRDCVVCNNIYDEYMRVAESFRFSSTNNKELFFAVVDYDEENNYHIFGKLQIKTVPAIKHFPANSGLYRMDSMDYAKEGQHAQDIARWIAKKTGVQIRITSQTTQEPSIVPLVLLIVALIAIFKFPDRTYMAITRLVSCIYILIESLALKAIGIIVKRFFFVVRSLTRSFMR